MPNPPASPTIVKVGVFIADIVDLDEVNETFQLEMILVASWEDPRLAFDPDIEGVELKIFQGPFQFDELYTAWWPQLVILNEVGSGDLNAIKIEVHPDGKVRYMEQRNVTLETPMSLREFPFDRQILKAYLIAFGETKKTVQLEVDSNVLGATEEYAEKKRGVNIAQWKLKNLDLEAVSIDYRYYGNREDISQIELSIKMERKSEHIIWDVIFPLIILVSMMWSIFWIDVDSLADRLNISFIGILTIVAYQFLVGDSLPRISYFTFTDAILLCSFVIMAATIFQSLYVFRLSKAGDQTLAYRIDTLSKWLFPAIYLAAMIVSYLVFVL